MLWPVGIVAEADGRGKHRLTWTEGRLAHVVAQAVGGDEGEPVRTQPRHALALAEEKCVSRRLGQDHPTALLSEPTGSPRYIAWHNSQRTWRLE